MGQSNQTDDGIERGLAEAFGGSASGESILHVLRALGGDAPHVHLRDEEEGDSQISVSHGREKRYELVREIARGGMGVVLRSHDIDLGRDVAMKVIRPEHAQNADVLRRFVEEAQIGGQLQHPGIVPVYELGLQEDQQVYFTMKLIQGRTLAELLKERAGPLEGRRRFLGIFESICQTIAYAHSRGVIHRDLKPANVMVGEFGEVQVVDWGFAKVLAAGAQEAPPLETDGRPATVSDSKIHTVRSGTAGSQSLAGSAMGTPAYMSREQAYGHIDQIDERADVFALGSTLCEILTGAPAYVKAQGQLLVQAAQRQLGDAWARLDACDSDRDLVELARACLAERDERPRDAGEVAQAVSSYLASVEERARIAEVTAAQERVKASEERKRRKLTVALTGTAVLVLLVGGGAWGWSEKQRLERVQSNGAAVLGAVQDATRLEGQALATGDVPKWEQALLAAHKARERAVTTETAPDATREADNALHRIQLAHAAAKAAAERAALDAQMASRIHEIRETIGHTMSLAQTDTDYASAFRDYGVDVQALDAEHAQERIVASAISGDLCAALDDWAAGLQQMSAAGAVRARGLLALAAESDPDPWRKAVRAAGAERDKYALGELAEGVEQATLAASSAVLMGRLLGALQTPNAQIAFLEAAQPYHPNDYWINLDLGVALHNEGERRAADAVSYLRAALAARPDSLEARHHLGLAQEENGEPEKALVTWAETLRLKPDYHHLHVHILTTLFKLRRLGEVIPEIQRAMKEGPNPGIAHWRMGIIHRLRQQHGAAVDSFSRALKELPTYASAYAGLCWCLRRLGRPENALKAAESGSRLEPDHGMFFLWQGQIHEQLGNVEAAFAAYEQALRTKPSYPLFRLAIATALVRAGRPEEALRHFEEHIEIHSDADRMPDLEYRLAAALWLEGYDREARAVARPAMNLLLERLRSEEDDLQAWYYLGGFQCDVFWKFDDAVESFKKAILLDPGDLGSQWGLQVAYLKSGNCEASARQLEVIVQRWSRHARAHQALAARRLELDDTTEAIKHLQRAIQLRNQDRTSHYLLSICLLQVGQYEQALAARAREYETTGWSEAWRYPKERWLREGESLVALARDADDILAGQVILEDPREMLLFAHLLQDRYESPAAMPFFRAALAADPALLEEHAPTSAPMRWLAMVGQTAVAAGTGWGVKAKAQSEEAARKLREEGRALMQQELRFLETKLDADPVYGPAYVAAALSSWRINMQRTRYGEPFLALAPEEREAWDAFWEDVNAVLYRAKTHR